MGRHPVRRRLQVEAGHLLPAVDHLALLSAPAEVLVARIAAPDDNPYGNDPREKDLILQRLAEVEPLLRATATVEIDAAAPLSRVVEQIERLAEVPRRTRG